MERLLRLPALLIAVGMLVGGHTPVYAASDAKPMVAHPAETKAMDALLDAVTKLRQATVLLLNQKEPGADRAAAVEATQNAVMLAQRAMLQLPPELRMAGKAAIHEAKDWPVVMSRLDSATQDLTRAAMAVRNAPAGKDRNKAIETMQKALTEVQQAMTVLPAWTPGQP